jgi:DNA replication protein DnaC
MKNPKNFLVFTGASGVGKTYFCSALTEWSFLTFNHRRYHREQDLLSKLRSGISEGQGDYLIGLKYLIDDDFVILDDIASGITPDRVTYRDLEFRREVFFAFLDYRYNSEKPTVITSNLTRQQFLDIYSERIESRLYATENTIIEMFGNDLDKRQMGM